MPKDQRQVETAVAERNHLAAKGDFDCQPIIEKDHQRCEYLAEHLINTLVINGDGTNLKLLEEEEIGSADVVIFVSVLRYINNDTNIRV